MEKELDAGLHDAEPTEELDLRSQIEAAVNKQREASPEPADPEAVQEPEGDKEAAARIRDEKGRFAAKSGEEPVEAPAAKPVATTEPQAAEPVATDTQIRPPPGWNPAAKVAFDTLPDEVKQAVARREEEVNKGFAKLAEYKPLEPFAEQAEANGRSLPQVLEEVTRIDNVFLQDKNRGLQMIMQRYGIDPVAFAYDLVTRSGGVPNQGAAGAGQQGYQTPPAGPDLSPVMAEINQLKTYIATQQQQEVLGTLQAFAADPAHKFFENVRPQMAALMDSGQATTLQDAYEAACWMNPEIRGLLIKQQAGTGTLAAPRAAVVAQAKAASKATNGAPAPGTRPGSAAPDPNMSIRDTIRAAVEQSRGRT